MPRLRNTINYDYDLNIFKKLRSKYFFFKNTKWNALKET